MDLFSYILKYDSGFAPNPLGEFCTLACCKPVIRRTSNVGDWILGTTPEPESGRLTYLMKVTRGLTFDYYFIDPVFQNKKPSPANPRGDNIYRPVGSGKYSQVLNPSHDSRHIEKDLSTTRVLISDHFFYFGVNAPPIPEKFQVLVAVTQGHKRIREGKDNRYPAFLSFLLWVENEYNPGIYGETTLADACCLPFEEEDLEES